MTPLQDKLRAALRETADEIPAQAPPLRLSPRPRASRNASRNATWRAWAAPLTAAALVVATVAASLAVAGSLKHQPAAAGPQAGPASVPAYYVALTTTAKPQSDLENMLDSASPTDSAAELRSTRTGAVLARITPPKPYVSFTGVTAAADDRTFVLSAQGPAHYPQPPFPAQRLFLLRIDPAARAGARMTLTALPAADVPAGDEITNLALSPDGTRLAAETAHSLAGESQLNVFDLATGTARSWSAAT